MTTFDKREDSFERQFAHDEELRFRAEDYAKRKGETIQAIEKWLAPNLNY